MRLKVSELLSRLNASYWFVPLLVTLGGVGLAVLLLYLDSIVSLDAESLWAEVRPKSPEGARALLSAVVGAMITAISVTFSVTIVALTVAAQHFGSLVLTKFVRHTSAQVVLGLLLATFAYAVLVLGSVRGSGSSVQIPELAVSGAVLLVAASVGGLIYYVHYISTSLQVGALVADISTELVQSITHQGATWVRPPGQDPEVLEVAPADAEVILAEQTGYVQRVDTAAIVALASRWSAVVWIRREPGAFLISGTPLGPGARPSGGRSLIRSGPAPGVRRRP